MDSHSHEANHSCSVRIARRHRSNWACSLQAVLRGVWCKVAAMVLLSVALHGVSHAQLGPPWEWRVSEIPDQIFDTRSQAEAALRALGGKFALAEVVQKTEMSPTHARYVYGARRRGPEIGEWRYRYGNQTFATEAEQVAVLKAIYDANAPECGQATVTPDGDWYPYRRWYSGDTYEEARYYLIEIFVRPDCDTVRFYSQIGRDRVVACPQFMSWSSAVRACVLDNIAKISVTTFTCAKDTVSDYVGNPCSVSTGSKSLEEIDLELPWISFSRSYQSHIDLPFGGFGPHWTHSFNVRRAHSGGITSGITTGSGHQIPVSGGRLLDGSEETFSSSSGKWYRADGSIRTFDKLLLARDDFPDGRWLTYAYDSIGRLETVTHSSGRKLTFIYESESYSDPATSRIKEIRLGDDTLLVSYAYDAAGNLAFVHRADGTSRQYHYEDPAHPHHLTGITDENGVRFATYSYDTYGRVILSEHAGGAGRVELAFQSDGSTVVTDAIGKVSTYRFTNDGYFRKPVSVELNGVSESIAYQSPSLSNPRRRVLQRTDRNGVVTKYEYSTYRDYDLQERVERTRHIEAFGTPRQRTVEVHKPEGSTLVYKVVAGGRTTYYTYNSRRQVVTQTEKDDVSGVERTTTNTYCEAVDLAAGCPFIGLLKSVDGPRTDVNDVTTYHYNEQGDLFSVTDALGHTTTYNAYNEFGLPLTITDPNGVVTSLAYDERQRLTSRTVGDETTSFEYWPTGLLKKATQPDGSYLLYTYDDAHRLTQISDADGNRIVYTLDAMGNRTAEEVYDPNNVLARTRTQVFNSLGQLWKQIGATGTAAVTTTYGYDGNGNRTTINAPLGRNTVSSYDELNRLIQIVDPDNGITQFSYDANDNLISVTDPRGLVTSYTYNGLGDLLQQVSPDTGTTVNTYDSAGNLATSTDARSKTATYSYDALNRVTEIAYPDRIISFTYDEGTNGIGRLTGASDANHSLAWTYDAHGRVIGKGQTVGSVTLSVGYGYQNGNLTSLVTPSGQTITYGYTNGKVTSITLNGSTTILSEVRHEPFGAVAGWTWGNGTLAVRLHDLDGKVESIDSAGAQSYTYDDAFRITAITDLDDPARSWTYEYDLLDRLNFASTTGQVIGYTYDANGNRLTQTGSEPATYTISSTSNRLSAVTGVLNRAYTYDAAGNTLSYAGLTFTYSDDGRMQSVTNAGVTTTYVFNALGQRVKKSNTSVTRLFVYDEAGHLLGEYGGTGALVQETIWLGDIPVATLRPNGSSVDVYYVHTDHLNTPRRISRPSDNVIVWRWDSDPFGSSAANEDPDGDSTPLVYNLRFLGQYFDAESGLNYNYFRDYDAATGRYAQSDPIGLRGGVNTYAYALSNPVSRIDPRGWQTPALCLNPANAAACAAAGEISEGIAAAVAAAAKKSAARAAAILVAYATARGGCEDEEEDDCRKEIEACSELCADSMTDPDRKHVFGGSMQQCIKNCLPERCGGEPKWKGYK